MSSGSLLISRSGAKEVDRRADLLENEYLRISNELYSKANHESAQTRLCGGVKIFCYHLGYCLWYFNLVT